MTRGFSIVLDSEQTHIRSDILHKLMIRKLLGAVFLQKTSSRHKKNKKDLAPLYTYIKQTDRNRKREYEHFLEYESERWDIPKEVLAGQPRIRMSGNHSMNFSGEYTLEEYSAEKIVLRTKRKSLVLAGEKLSIRYFRKDEIKIVGNIQTISFCR